MVLNMFNDSHLGICFANSLGLYLCINHYVLDQRKPCLSNCYENSLSSSISLDLKERQAYVILNYWYNIHAQTIRCVSFRYKYMMCKYFIVKSRTGQRECSQTQDQAKLGYYIVPSGVNLQSHGCVVIIGTWS